MSSASAPSVITRAAAETTRCSRTTEPAGSWRRSIWLGSCLSRTGMWMRVDSQQTLRTMDHPMRPFDQRTSRDEIDGLLERTSSADVAERVAALRSLCPCHVKRNEPRVWDRILTLVGDESPKVRSHVFHQLADG